MQSDIEQKVNKNSVLFIDDEEVAVEPYINLLNSAGFEVFYISSGLDCDAFIEKHNISLVILDLVMPYFDGIEVLKLIRRKWSKEDLPIVMLSSKTSDFDVEMALVNGANQFINKLEGTKVVIDCCKKLVSSK